MKMGLESGDSAGIDKLNHAKKLCSSLQSENRKVRKDAYVALETFYLETELSFEELRNIFAETHIYFLNGFRDKAENVREQAIRFVSFLISSKLPLNDYYLTYIFPIIVERIGTVELIEESEEVRLQLLQLMQTIVSKYSNTEQLKPFLNDMITVYSETVKDKYPAIKDLSCKGIRELAEALPKDFHLQAQSLTKPVLSCFSHQRFKIRVESIKTIGVIVMHSSYKALEEAVGPLAERLFDQIPLVRRTVAQVAALWLLEYRDRYSFFHKILPLLLTGLNDEVEETRKEAHELWIKVGLQYQKENEKDLKDKLDYLYKPLKYYPEGIERPNLGCRELVQRNVSKIAGALSKELLSWQEDVRVRCSQLLCSITLLAEEGLTMHLQELLPAMYSAARDDDVRVVQNIERASEIMGFFVPFDAWSKLILPAIEDGVHFGHLVVLGSIIKGSPKELIAKHLEEVAKLLAEDYICFNRKKKFQLEMAKTIESISCKFDPSFDDQLSYNLFKIATALVSLKVPENESLLTETLLQKLSVKLQIDSVSDLWHKFSPELLLHINKDPKSWTKVTDQCCIFWTFLNLSNEAFGENLDTVAEILEQALSEEADPEQKLKTFWILSDSFEKKEIIFKNGLEVDRFLERMINEVFVPNLVWHAGSTAEAIRTMAGSCLLTALVPIQGIDLFGSGLRAVLDKLLPLLVSLMEDASYRSRKLAVECVVQLKSHACRKGIWSLEDFIKVYPEVLKRLDDPTDKVRMSVLEQLPEVLKDCPNEFKDISYKAHHELIVDTLLVHFDDDEEKVKLFIFDALKAAAGINGFLLRDKVERHKPLLRNRDGCEKVIEYLENLKN